jgi:hypothetical protein
MKMNLLRPALLLLLPPFFCSSCLLPMLVRVPRHVPFNESEFAGYGSPGTGSVSGQLVVNIDGTVCIGNGDTITLVPVTSYTQEMVDRELGQGALLTAADPRLKRYVKKTTGDSHGNFAFQQVPAGRYFVAGLAGYNDISNEDNFVYQWGCERITVGQGQNVRIQVTHNPAKSKDSPGTDKWTAE